MLFHCSRCFPVNGVGNDRLTEAWPGSHHRSSWLIYRLMFSSYLAPLSGRQVSIYLQSIINTPWCTDLQPQFSRKGDHS